MCATTNKIPAAYTQRPDELICTLLRAGWSQEKIAEHVGTTQPTIHRIYSRKRDPRYSLVEKLRELVLNMLELTSEV